MSEPTFTKGPWKWFDYPDGRKLLCADSCAVIHCPDAPMAIDPPDARLIAASPDLYAALKQVQLGIGTGVPIASGSATDAMITGALAKVEAP